MPQIIKADGIQDDTWTLLGAPAEGESLDLPDGPVIVPLTVWQAERDTLKARGDVGVWLESHEEPEALVDDVAALPLIAVNFPKFTDGRGYSIGRLLRERFGFTGELRAIGDVLLDQLQFMRRCGFDAYALRPDKDVQQAEYCLNFFSMAYQADVHQKVPLFRRRDAS